jgi:glucokinase
VYSIGVDLGGTKICTGIIDEQGVLVHSHETPTLAEKGPEAVIERIKATIDAALEQARGTEVAGIGIGAPGPLNPYRGVVLGPPNLPGWDEIPLAKMIHEAYKLPVYLENDANAAAIAEHRFGAGKGTQQMVYITVSTGIGAGVVVDGQVRQGATGAFGELGHIIVDPDGPPCSCGNRGCLEAVASGTAIARMAREVYGKPITAKEVAALAEDGDQTAQQILDKAFRFLGLGLVNAVNLFDPEVIVVGGGVAQIGDPLFNVLRECVAANRFHHASANIRVVPAQLGTKAGVIGAAAIPLIRR